MFTIILAGDTDFNICQPKMFVIYRALWQVSISFNLGLTMKLAGDTGFNTVQTLGLYTS